MNTVAKICLFSLVCLFVLVSFTTAMEVNGAGRRASLVAIAEFVWLGGVVGILTHGMLRHLVDRKCVNASPWFKHSIDGFVPHYVFLSAGMILMPMTWTYEVLPHAVCFALPVGIAVWVIEFYLQRRSAWDTNESHHDF